MTRWSADPLLQAAPRYLILDDARKKRISTSLEDWCGASCYSQHSAFSRFICHATVMSHRCGMAHNHRSTIGNETTVIIDLEACRRIAKNILEFGTPEFNHQGKNKRTSIMTGMDWRRLNCSAAVVPPVPIRTACWTLFLKIYPHVILIT